MIIDNIRGDGKYLVIFSDAREFIYGDGFYNNLSISSQYQSDTRILLPLTPRIAVLHALPMEYMVEPRLVTLEANDELASLINETTQIYSKECLFFRFEQPHLSEHFVQRAHLQYAEEDPICTLVQQIPGVRVRSRQLYSPG